MISNLTSMDKRLSAVVCSVALLCHAAGAVSSENAVARMQSRSVERDASSVSLVQAGETIAFLGDSITYYGNSRPLGYIHLVMRGLEAVGVNALAIPAGVGGHKSNQMLARLDRDVLSRKPQWMTLSCGVNDVWHAHLPGRKGVPLADYQRNITEILERCAASGVKVILMTPTMVSENPDDVRNMELEQYCVWLREIAAKRKLPIADLNADMRRKSADLRRRERDSGDKLTRDGVHRTVDGDELMARGILAAMGVDADRDGRVRQAWADYRKSVLADESRFVPLFNGKDLEEWEGATNTYCVTSDGLLTCRQGSVGGKKAVRNLWTKKNYADFVIRFEVKLPPNANNGLGIRTKPNGWCSREGMEIQLLDDWGDRYNGTNRLSDVHYTGAIYGVVPPKRKPDGTTYLKPTGEWNAVEVTAIGTKITVVLNGEKIVDADVSQYSTDGTVPPDGIKRPGLHNRTGRIHWCGHGEDIFWRNIRIREL